METGAPANTAEGVVVALRRRPMKPLPYINTSGERKDSVQMQIEQHVNALTVSSRRDLASRGRSAGLGRPIAAESGDRSQRASNMTLDPSSQNSDTEQLPPDTRGLQSLALDAYLTGHQQVADNLAALANRLIETNGCAPLRAVAKEILARANAPGQDFATLLDPFELPGLASEFLPNEVPTTNDLPRAAANPDAKTSLKVVSSGR